jgi:hypothetical protein
VKRGEDITVSREAQEEREAAAAAAAAFFDPEARQADEEAGESTEAEKV